MLRATMDISAHAISLASRPRPGQQGHQYSHAPGIRPHHIGKVLSVDGHDIRRVSAEEKVAGSIVIGEYRDPDVARRHVLLGLQGHRPLV
jgi:hypothetical protein